MRLFILILLLPTVSHSFNSYLVKLKSPVQDQQVRAWGLEKVTHDLVVIEKAKLNDFRTQMEIEKINPNHIIVPLETIPNDLLDDQWGILNIDFDVDTNVTKAWDITTGSREIVVAITDTGLDISHPDLKDNLWRNPKEYGGKPGVDDDGNGYIDDIHGWDLATNTSNLADPKRHGTHVAGIVGATGNNGQGLVGVNWQVSLMAAKFFHDKKETTVADAIKAIDYSIDNGAHIINASWGAAAKDIKKEEYDFLYEAIERAKEKGVLFVAAAGNNNADNDLKPQVPAALSNDNIITVGAITRYGWKPSFSNWGATTVDVFAPGSTIKSTLPGAYYGNLNGTSMAAPFVAGIAALMLADKPELTLSQMTKKLLSSCDPNSNLMGRCQCGGHINAMKALK